MVTGYKEVFSVQQHKKILSMYFDADTERCTLKLKTMVIERRKIPGSPVSESRTGTDRRSGTERRSVTDRRSGADRRDRTRANFGTDRRSGTDRRTP